MEICVWGVGHTLHAHVTGEQPRVNKQSTLQFVSRSSFVAPDLLSQCLQFGNLLVFHIEGYQFLRLFWVNSLERGALRRLHDPDIRFLIERVAGETEPHRADCPDHGHERQQLILALQNPETKQLLSDAHRRRPVESAGQQICAFRELLDRPVDNR
jgi:hypothetical protein